MKRLLIISHTEHYIEADGTVVGLSSTITEINHLTEIFDSITHIAMLHDGSPPAHMRPYESGKVEFVPMKVLGGKTLKSKLGIIGAIPKILRIVRYQLIRHDYFQFRAPTGIGVFVIPYLVLFSKKPGWFKYAGSWNQADAPVSYRFQKWILRKQKRKVTINGIWPDQPRHCLTFDNPCLTEAEITAGKIARENGFKFNDPIDFCFVGRLEDAKGVNLIIEAFNNLTEKQTKKVGAVHLIGDGNKRMEYEQLASKSGVDFKFHGWLSREEVHYYMKKSASVLLPSASEGLPKVVPEAINYGCIPFISNIQALSELIINKKNGFVLKERTISCFLDRINRMLCMTGNERRKMIEDITLDINHYSYKYYIRRIENEIFNN